MNKVIASYNGIEIEIPNTSIKDIYRLQQDWIEFPHPLYCIIKGTSQKVYLALSLITFYKHEQDRIDWDNKVHESDLKLWKYR